MAIARNASVPFGAPYSEFGVYDTEYRTVCDLTNRCYYFELSTAPNVIWTELDKLDFEPGAPVMTLDPDNIGPRRRGLGCLAGRPGPLLNTVTGASRVCTA